MKIKNHIRETEKFLSASFFISSALLNLKDKNKKKYNIIKPAIGLIENWYRFISDSILITDAI
ncbi:MAG TPA: hypothetical protein PLQ81_02750 [bacterium]|nr:hypothetical protein [bacterium]